MSNSKFNQHNLTKTIIKDNKTFTIFLLGTILFLFANITVQAATFTVANTNDNGPGSLRQAILDANVNNENDTINFDPAVFSTPQTIILTTGQLSIERDDLSGSAKTLTIIGPGADLLTISGNNQSRVIFVNPEARLSLEKVKITGGNGMSGGPVTSTDGLGGGILVSGGSLNDGLYLILRDSIVDGNKTLTQGGAGIVVSGNSTIINTTISNNIASEVGGGLRVGRLVTLHLINSTVSHNKAGSNTGGIHVSDRARVYLTNSTISYNEATEPGINPRRGSGVNMREFTILYAKNSIIANNLDQNKSASDIWGDVTSLGNNIIGNTSGISTMSGDTTGDQLNVNPQLDPVLQSNGGVIPTHALHANSPAIDAGDNCVLNTPENGGCATPNILTDLRGVLRPQDGDGNGTATVDIGAFEILASEVSNSPNAPDLQAVSDTGISDSDNITKSRNLSFEVSGTVKGITYEFLRNGEPIGSKISDSSTITFSDQNLPADGVFVYSVRQVIDGIASFQSSVVVTIDNTSPTVTINQAGEQADPTNFQAANFRVFFSENIVGFDRNAISLANSTAGVSTANIGFSGSGLRYDVSVSNITSDGILIAEIPANVVQDLAGNSNTASTSTDNSVKIDTTPPTVTINQSTGQEDPTKNTPINFTVVFSEPVNGFTNADISLAGSTANIGSAVITVSGSGTTYNVEVYNFSSNGGFVQASVKNQAAADPAGNLSAASTSTDNAITVDNISPTATFRLATGQANPTNSLPINFTVVFSEPVTGFDAADISFANSSIDTSTASIDVTGSGTTYNVAIGNINSNGGSLLPTIRSSAASDAFGNFNAGSIFGPYVQLDNVAPTVSINQAIGQSDPTSVQPVKFSVVFSEPVTGFAANDVSLSGSTANVSFANISVTGGGSVYTVNISNITSSGQVRASLIVGAAQDAKGNSSLASTSTDNVVTINVKRSQFDFDRDGKSDISVFRPDNGTWYLQQSTAGFAGTVFGISTDKIVPADYDGDGKTDIAVFRDGIWHILGSASGYWGVSFGFSTDIPVPADYDGDGKADVAVFREGIWHILGSSSGYAGVQFGLASDKPVAGDYDGDGKADVAVYRPENGVWYLLQSSAGFAGVAFGISTDKPIPADYDGDGKTDIAVYRDGIWYLLQSTNGFTGFQFGIATDLPTPADYDGDGKADAAVFRDGAWYLLQSTNGFAGVQFGNSTDQPIPNAFVP